MKVRVLILALLSTNLLMSQKLENKLDFQIMCGFAAYTSADIQDFKTFVDQKDSVTIKNKLFEGAEIEQILSAIILKHYNENSFLKLSKSEMGKIIEVSKSKSKFSICFTCTFQQEGTVKQLFNQKDYLPSYNIIEEYLLNKF